MRRVAHKMFSYPELTKTKRAVDYRQFKPFLWEVSQ